MALTTSELESLRFHLGYGNIGLGVSMYTPDGFKLLFDEIIGPYLTGSTETTATTSIAAGTSVTVTPVSMTGIVPYAKLVIDVGDEVELVAVRSVTVSSFTAKFAKAHPSSGYPIALMGGHARLRLLLNQAETAWSAMQDPSIGATAGLHSVDKNDVVWFEGFQVLKDRLKHYYAIVAQISSLVRVDRVGAGSSGQMSLY